MNLQPVSSRASLFFEFQSTVGRISLQLQPACVSFSSPTDFSRIWPQIIQTFGAISFYLVVQIFKPSLKRRMQEQIETEPVGMRGVQRDKGRTAGENGREKERDSKRERKRDRARRG